MVAFTILENDDHYRMREKSINNGMEHHKQSKKLISADEKDTVF